MSESQSHDAVLRAFKAVRAEGTALSPVGVAAVYVAVTTTAEEMRRAGQPIERVIARLKAIASDANVRETHDRLVTSAVLWAIDYYYREDLDGLDPLGPAEIAARLRTLLKSDGGRDFEALLGGSDSLPVAPESPSIAPSRHVSP